MKTTYTCTPTAELLALPEGERIIWAEALESGEYEQGFGRLWEDGRYCCLGVLESINGRSDAAMRTINLPSGFADPVCIGGKRPEHVPFATAGCFPNWKGTPDILNDDIRLTFLEIAALLRGQSIEVESALSTRIPAEEAE